MISLAVILSAAHLVGHAFERLGQPRLVGEIVAGGLLGPHVLGRMLLGSSAIRLVSVGLSARLAGFRGLEMEAAPRTPRTEGEGER